MLEQCRFDSQRESLTHLTLLADEIHDDGPIHKWRHSDLNVHGCHHGFGHYSFGDDSGSRNQRNR